MAARHIRSTMIALVAGAVAILAGDMLVSPLSPGALAQRSGGKDGGGGYSGGGGGHDFSYDPRTAGEAAGVPEARRSLRAAEAAKQKLRGKLRRCSEDDPLQEFHRCIADALDTFARDIASPQIVLPPAIKAAPAIVARAASEVRRAPTRRAARAAVQSAEQTIRKSIELIKAELPVIDELQTRLAKVIASSLELADAKLEKGIEL